MKDCKAANQNDKYGDASVNFVTPNLPDLSMEAEGSTVEKVAGGRSGSHTGPPRKFVLVLQRLLANFVAQSHTREAPGGNSAPENHQEDFTEARIAEVKLIPYT